MENPAHATEEVHLAVAERASPPKLSDGRDELNLAEFPLSAIADRLHPDLKTIRFEDRIWDEQRGEMITRQLTITASDDHGLPTALDDEVILGLIQLSKLQHFVDRKVHFTRYQLLQLLDWRDESKSYARLETSLNRWAGVTLYYQNAWWSKDEQCWVDEKFHILDNVTLYGLDRLKRRRQAARQPMLPLSSFRWNEVIFRSFQVGNLKSIDFDFFKRLNSAVAKRLYRFLDKRFFHRPRCEFDLKEFCWEHVGLSRHYDTANLKRKLRPAIEELQQHGFLQTMSLGDRFRKVRSGKWRVVFEKANLKNPRDDGASAQPPTDTTLERALIERGVNPSVARETVAAVSPERIHTQLEVFDWLLEQRDAKVTRNPAGFLISSIKSEYVPPRSFVSRAEQELRARKTAARRQQLATREQAILATQEAKQQAREAEIARFWQSLSQDERLRLKQEALKQSPAFQRELAAQEGKLGAAARKNLLHAYALKMLQAGV